MQVQDEYNFEIPKVIHYCWFGGNELGEKELACIESWKRYLPDYEIKRWDESNFDINCCLYVKEAYEAKKWAFVSDYARFQILYDCGGVYFDTDVELIKPIDDILCSGPFMGLESDCLLRNGDKINQLPRVNPGLGLAASAGMPFYASVIESYRHSRFISPGMGYDETTIVDRVTNLLYQYGLENKPGIQMVAGIHIYPAEYYCPMEFDSGELTITNNTRSIHWFGATWLSTSQKVELKMRRVLIGLGLNRELAKKASAAVATIICLDFNRLKRWINKNKVQQ